MKSFLAMFNEKIKEHREKFDENNIRDYVDMFLKEMSTKDAHSSFTVSKTL